MATKFCCGKSPTTSCYTIGYIGFLLRLYVIIILSGFASNPDYFVTIFPLSWLVFFWLAQILLIIGIWKKIPQLLFAWIVTVIFEIFLTIIFLILLICLLNSGSVFLSPMLANSILALILQVWTIFVVVGASNEMKTENVIYVNP